MIAHMLGDSMVPVVAGLVLGAAGAVALTGLLGAWLFEVDGLELPVLVAATGTLGLVSAVSAWIPARRAASVPPAETLRSD